MILFIYPFIAFIEFKAPGRPLTGDRNQDDRIAELRARGYPVLITDNADEALAFMEAVALSSTGYTLDDLSGMRGATLAPRLREDIGGVRILENLIGQRIDQVSPSGGSPTSGIQRLADPEGQLGGVPGAESDRPPWE